MDWLLKGKRRAEIVVLVAIVVLFLVVVLPPARWVSDGDIQVPVKIFVFDAVHGRPISNAECLVFRGAPVMDELTLAKHPLNDFPISECPQECRGITDISGYSVIEHKFGTSASHKNPVSHAHLMNAWVRVEANGYGGIVVPIGYDERPAAVLRKDGQVLISIGLMPVK